MPTTLLGSLLGAAKYGIEQSMTKRQKNKNERTLPISAASLITNVEIHTLRYWEQVFYPFLNPDRTLGGQRRYRSEDIQTVLSIKQLLRDEMFSIAGARKHLASLEKEAAA